MSKLPKLFAIALLSVLLANCGSKEPESNSSASDANSVSTTGASTNETLSNNSPGGQMQPAYNGETKQVADGFPVPANANVTIVQTNQAQATMKEKPAPDDSTFSAEMNAKGQPVETRTFRSHPVLAKVEKITMSPRDYVFKVYLKNGKVIESKSAELKDFRVIAPVNILDAVGMKPPPKPVPSAQKPEDMKKPIMIPKASP